MNKQDHIRNFSIIAHIDHGKTTLTDRILEITRAIPQREMRDRYLDKMDLEQEKGITIKLQPIRTEYKRSTADQNQNFILNLIDTPGHVDFSYEVSRSLAACEGAILLVDLSQGVQAQTLSHFQTAKKLGLALIPVINKIDLNLNSSAEQQLISLGFKKEEIIKTSGKTGQGIEELLESIVKKIPPPSGSPQKPLRGLVFDSYYDDHQGVVLLVKIVDGDIRFQKQSFPRLKLMANDTSFVPLEIGYLKANLQPQPRLTTGEVGYLATGLKNIKLGAVGDTITKSEVKKEKLKITALPGYQKIKPRVFAGLYPAEAQNINNLKEALSKLSLNDASLTFTPESSPILGSGFRIGCLGQFHLEIIRERLEREFSLSVISTAPTVPYRVIKKDKEVITITSVSNLPPPDQIESIHEPWIKAVIISPHQYLGKVMRVCQISRGKLQSTDILGQENSQQLKLTCLLPLNELFENFFQRLKSATSGFASFDYELLDYRRSDIVKLDFLINRQVIEPLSLLLPRTKAVQKAQEGVHKLKKLLPHQQFAVPIQAAVNGRIIARTDLKAIKKDVTAKLYGGDRTRKDKLLQKQKKGKKRLKRFGKIKLPLNLFPRFLRHQ
ncbi:elongation factor 4 [candidate division CPR3 bacterium 4484_211]|uniref:Elongation factor 4 n=1 Tax=candidate division CPR3 bacterium 4484_211 TaxID=1968527 RepID=A0A1W9NYI9_UNCC3|nr:MAG: elongation factor 4 [candidate division CPR3 bacterium 4484_211]